MKTIMAGDRQGGILFDIQKERERQEFLLLNDKFPWSCDDIFVPDGKKLAVLAEEFGEAAKVAAQIQEQYDRHYPDEAVRRRRGKLRAELIQVAAVCVAWCEALDDLENRAQIRDAQVAESTEVGLMHAESNPRIEPTAERSWPEVLCSTCGKQVSFDCRAHYIRDIRILEAQVQLLSGGK